MGGVLFRREGTTNVSKENILRPHNLFKCCTKKKQLANKQTLSIFINKKSDNEDLSNCYLPLFLACSVVFTSHNVFRRSFAFSRLLRLICPIPGKHYVCCVYDSTRCVHIVYIRRSHTYDKCICKCRVLLRAMSFRWDIVFSTLRKLFVSFSAWNMWMSKSIMRPMAKPPFAMVFFSFCRVLSIHFLSSFVS